MIDEIDELFAVLEEAFDSVSDIAAPDLRRQQFAAQIVRIEQRRNSRKRRAHNPPPSLAQLIRREVAQVFAEHWAQNAPPGRKFDGEYLAGGGVKMKRGARRPSDGDDLQLRESQSKAEYDAAIANEWDSSAQRSAPKPVKPRRNWGGRRKQKVTLAPVKFLERDAA